MTPADIYARQMQERSAPSKLANIRQKVANRQNKRANENLSMPIPQEQASQASYMLNAYMKRLNEADAMKQLELNNAKNDERYNQPISGLGNTGSSLLEPAVTVLHGKSGPGIQNQISHIVLKANDPFAPSIKKMALENLKYSQGRGEGCTDCSAATQRWYKETTGKNIGGNSETQWKNGTSVPFANAKNGDLIFFKSPKPKYKNRNVTHVAKYNGDGTFTDFGTGGLRTRPIEGYALPVVGIKSYI